MNKIFDMKPLWILFFCLIKINLFSQKKYNVKITAVSCFSNYEVWIDEVYFEKLPMKSGKVILKKDTALYLEKNKLNILLDEHAQIIDSTTKRIDIAMKVVFYKKNKIQKVIYLDSSGSYKIGNTIYAKNPTLMAYIKGNYDAEYCCFCLQPCKGQ